MELGIWQVDRDEHLMEARDAACGDRVDPRFYKKVFAMSYPSHAGANLMVIAERVFRDFNRGTEGLLDQMERVYALPFHSLSVGDIITLDDVALLVCSAGFERLPEWIGGC